MVVYFLSEILIIYDPLSVEYTDTLDNLTVDEQKANVTYITRYLSSVGASASCILGLVSNMCAESELNPRKRERRRSDGVIVGYGNGQGLIQWSSTTIDAICERSPYGGSWAVGGKPLMLTELWKVAVECGIEASEDYGVLWSGSPHEDIIAAFGTPISLNDFTSKNVGDESSSGSTLTAQDFYYSYMCCREVPAIVRDGDVDGVQRRLNLMAGYWSRFSSTVNSNMGLSYKLPIWFLCEVAKRWT